MRKLFINPKCGFFSYKMQKYKIQICQSYTVTIV